MNTPHASQWDCPSGDELEPARLGEITDGLLGRCAARLLVEIESYLEFFAIARSPAL